MYFYVIMPLGIDSEAIQKKKRIVEIAQRADISAHFPNYFQNKPNFNLNLLLNDIQKADFVLADLSYERPSCYYEVGLTEALGKKIYLIAQRGTDIHQTAERENVIYYKNLDEFENILKQIILKEGLKDQK